MTVSSKLAAITILAALSGWGPIGASARPHDSRFVLMQALDHAATAQGVLNRDQASAIFPANVFFRGQSAPIQGRNSAGIRLASGKLVLMALVDTSGYSSAVQEKYQAYLLTEVPLILGGQRLAPGAYGFGFLGDNHMVVMDIGGNVLMTTSTTRDDALSRPNPLQVVAAGNGFRLYLGRSNVTLALEK